MDYKARQVNFYTPEGDLRPELLDSEAKGLAQSFAQQKGDDSVSSTQLRRFYNDVKQLQHKIEKDLGEDKIDSQDPKDLSKHLALVKMLKAKVAYARRSGTRENVSQRFVETIDRCVDSIQSPRDFRAFARFFEAIVAYYYYYEAAQREGKKRR
jgi:CRISPR type III-A-associated protein Csm2